MIPLPEKGDVKAACDVLDERVRALSNGGSQVTADVRVEAEAFTGAGMAVLLRAYGDLYDIDEFMNYVGKLLVAATTLNIVQSRDSTAALTTMMLQSVAIGVLMERGRWQR